jgi:Carbohydrate-selective porin, OprB family
MKNALSIFVMMCLFLFSGNVWADGAAVQTQIDQLKQRLEELEKKKDSPESPGTGMSKGIADKITFSGVIAGAYQYESVSGPSEADDFGRGAMPVQAEVGIKPTSSDEIFFKFGFAAGNGLNTEKHLFALAPWAADLEDDVKNINGRNRDYLLAAWYKHMFTFGQERTLGITGGIIDATDYLDENRYANDEYTQFMNEALVNGPNAFLPSYDIGGSLEWEIGRFAVKGVVMQVGENDEGRAYNFFGVQVGCTLETPIGQGTYRVLADATSDDFSDPDGVGTEPLRGIILSFDQEIGENLGAWVRFGTSDDKALINFKDLYSGGIDINGNLWGRKQDNIGIGYAYLSGGNMDIDRVQVAEGYIRFELNEILALTLDVQYLDDTYKEGAGDDVDGWITGVRVTAEF